MVSRFVGPGGPRGVHRARALGRGAATLTFVTTMACGFADGDPIVTGDTLAASTGPGLDSTGLATGPDASTGTLASGPDTAASEASGSGETDGVPSCRCEDRQPGDRCLRFINECDQPVWAGASGEEDPAGAFDAVSWLDPQACLAVTVREAISARAFGRTACIDDVCAADGNAGRGTLVQLNLPLEGTDVYDVSLVDGFNVPMAMIPVATSYPTSEPCRAASCAADLTVVCPEALLRYDDQDQVAYCASPCQACTEACPDCNDCADLAGPACAGCSELADLCCTGQACQANEHTMLWKSLCPDAITYPDDASARACTQRTDFDIVFCP
jgi:hypothetical protein